MKKLYTKIKYHSESEWLANRQGGFGGSSVSALFGINPYLTALDIYCSATSPKSQEAIELEKEETANTIYGHKAEPIIRDLIKLNLSKKYKVISPRGFAMYRRKDKPFMLATIDGELIELETNRKGVLEIKTYEFRGNNDLDEQWGIQPPLRYSLQVLHYLAVLNDHDFAKLVAKIRWVDYDTGLVKKEEIRYYHFEREGNAETIAKIEQVETDFNNNHILPRIPPDVSCDVFKQ